MLEIRDLNKIYEGFRIENLNLEIGEGELLTLLGESGSGKSTVLRIAAALDEEYSGTVELNGIDIKNALKSGEIAVVFQDPLLLNHINLWENIRFSIRFKKLGSVEEKRRIMEVIELLELEGLEKRYPHELSGGQRQRVAIARALVMKPKFLLMDEPFSALDAPLRIRLQEKIKEIQKEKKLTVLFITHDRDEAFAISDRIGVMKQGEIVQIDTPRELYEKPNSIFIARFLGMENIYPKESIGKIFGDSLCNSLGKFDSLVMRSEDLRIKPESSIERNPESKIIFTGILTEHIFKSGFYEFTLKLQTDEKIKVRQHRVDFEIVTGREMEISIRREDIIVINQIL